MHEIGMLHEVAKTVSKIATEQQVEQVKYISLEVGELSGVIPEFFENSYPIVVEKYPLLKGSELKIRMVPGEALCDDCHALYNVMKNEGQCPRCQSRYKTILGGQKIILQHIGY